MVTELGYDASVVSTVELMAGAGAHDTGAKAPQRLQLEVRGMSCAACVSKIERCLRAQIGDAPLIAVIEPRSNTMRLGSHMEALPASVADASQVFWYQPAGLDWSLDGVVSDSPVPAQVASDLDAIVEQVVAAATPQTRVVVMSNGGFGGIHQRLIQALEARHG